MIGPRAAPLAQHRVRLTPLPRKPDPIMTSVSSLDQAWAEPSTFVEWLPLTDRP